MKNESLSSEELEKRQVQASMKTTPQEERSGLNPCDCGESPVHSVNGHKTGGFKGNSPQEEIKKLFEEYARLWYQIGEYERRSELPKLEAIKSLITKQIQSEVLREVREKIEQYREDLRFVWRWIDRCHGGKEHDKPEENWKNYIGVLVAYPNSPHETGDWFEDEDLFLSTLESKE